MKALGVTTAFKPNFYYIVYDVLVGVKDVFLLCCPLVLYLLKPRKIRVFFVGVFWNNKKIGFK